MGFLQRLANLFTPPSPPRRYLPLKAQCARCGEIVTGKIHLGNDLSIEYSPSGEATYVCRKVLIGEGAQRCFQQIDITLTFNAKRQVIDEHVTGGKLLLEPGDYAKPPKAPK